jgi:aerobic carbon-monoxide dehydrogenase large subunit
MTFWSGEKLGAVARDEARLLRGEGLFVDDMRLAGEVHGYVLRSPHAHARIRSIDRSSALHVPGILAVLTAADLAGIVRPLGCVMALTSFDGRSRAEAGAAAAPPAIMNAIADALSGYSGVWDLQMPALAAEIRRLVDAGG